MRPPFPGMDPWLEHPDLWPDVHNRLIAALADAMSPRVAPRYYIGLEQRTYEVRSGELGVSFVPDQNVVSARPGRPNGGGAAVLVEEGVGVREVELPMPATIRETYLEVREVGVGRLVTLIEVLSPANKLARQGRKRYLRKRERILESRTHLVEIDLLRAGRPMPACEGGPEGGYRVLVSREPARPGATVYDFGVRDPIPAIPLPLGPDDPEPPMELGPILHALYDRARFDLRLRYDLPPVPPLAPDLNDWASGVARSLA